MQKKDFRGGFKTFCNVVGSNFPDYGKGYLDFIRNFPDFHNVWVTARLCLLLLNAPVNELLKLYRQMRMRNTYIKFVVCSWVIKIFEVTHSDWLQCIWRIFKKFCSKATKLAFKEISR